MNLGNILICGAGLEKRVFCLPAQGQLAFSRARFQHSRHVTQAPGAWKIFLWGVAGEH